MKKFHHWLFRLVFFVGLAFVFFPASPKAEALTPSQITAVDQAVEQIVAGIPSWADTDVEKALYLHDYVVDNVAYEMVGEHQNAYGALIDGKAVCAGYADAYLKLLNAVGIEARTMTGTSKGERHAWTQVYLNGKCYYTDTTWDDPFVDEEQVKTHNYFNLSYQEMAKDHTFDSASLKYVDTSCTHSGIDYYDIMAGEGTGVAIFDDDTTAKEAAKYFVLREVDGTTAYFYCDFRFDGDDITTWRDNTIWNIATELGLTGERKASWIAGDKGYQMTLSGTKKNASDVKVSYVYLTPKSVSLSYVGQTYILTTEIKPANATNQAVSYKSSNNSVATVNSSGIVTAVGDGTATITVTTADGNKTSTCTVTVSLAHTHDSPLRRVLGVAPTCTKGGSSTYYVCDSCGDWFSDTAGKNAITDADSVNLPATGHKASDWKHDDTHHWKECTNSGCDAVIDKSKAKHTSTAHCDTCGYTVPTTDPSVTTGNNDPTAGTGDSANAPSSDPADTNSGEKREPNDFEKLLMEKVMLIGGIAVGIIVLTFVLLIIIKIKRR